MSDPPALRIGPGNSVISKVPASVIRNGNLLTKHLRMSDSRRTKTLRDGGIQSLRPDDAVLVVKPDVAVRQLAAEAQETAPERGPGAETVPGIDNERSKTTEGTSTGESSERQDSPKRFHARVRLDPNRVTKETSTIVDEVLQHLTSQLGVDVDVELEIEAKIPHGADPGLIRILSENCTALKFSDFGFEDE